MLPRNLLLFAGILTLMSCQPNADLVVHNALVYTVNKDLDKVQAFAVKDGKFIDVGNNDILDNIRPRMWLMHKGFRFFQG